MKKILLIIIPVLYFGSYLYEIAYKNCLAMVLKIVFGILFCLIFIPNIFGELLKLVPKKNIHFHGLHIMYALFPMALLGQYFTRNQPFLIVIIFILSSGNLFILYNKYKNLIKIHMKYLSYSNLFIGGIFTFLLTFLSLYKESLQNLFSLIFIMPLLSLQILYAKIDILDEEKE